MPLLPPHWLLHRQLTISSGNPIYTLILNGFGNIYEQLARVYFETADARAQSFAFYSALAQAAQNHDADHAGEVSHAAMLESINRWQHVRLQEKALDQVGGSGSSLGS